MTGKVVNLRRARKTKARAEKATIGTERAAKFGRSKAQKTLEETEQDIARKHLDGIKRDGR